MRGQLDRVSDTVSSRPFPPGWYPVVVVGSGPGGLQTSYFLSRLGVEHAVLSADDGPRGHVPEVPALRAAHQLDAPQRGRSTRKPRVRGARPEQPDRGRPGPWG